MDAPFLRILFGAVVLAIMITLLVGVMQFSGTQTDTALETNQQVRRPCAILLVLVMAHLTAGLFLEDYAAGASQISSPSVRHFALMISQVYDRTMINHPGIRLGIAALVVALLIRALMGRSGVRSAGCSIRLESCCVCAASCSSCCPIFFCWCH